MELTVLARNGRGRDTTRRALRAMPVVISVLLAAVVASATGPHIRACVELAVKVVGTASSFVLVTCLLLQGLGGPEAEVLPALAPVVSLSGRQSSREARFCPVALGVATRTVTQIDGVTSAAPRSERPAPLVVANTVDAFGLA